MSKYRYKEVKNYIHNELKLTKEDIKEIMIPIVKEEVKRTSSFCSGNRSLTLIHGDCLDCHSAPFLNMFSIACL